ncbi:pectinesterase-like [Coffea arabica]|uniref:Pectinesterase n=1 Tax=Coffea arabica TaxID=13443 RepID=A0A6P6W1T4_COFAR|nr:pectinesterase-like [Coffea arabica]
MLRHRLYLRILQSALYSGKPTSPNFTAVCFFKMTSGFAIFLFIVFAVPSYISCEQELEAVRAARFGILQAVNWAQSLRRYHDHLDHGSRFGDIAIADCLKLYEESEPLLAWLELSSKNYSQADAVTWLSAALASHRSCLDGLEEKGLSFDRQAAQNLTLLLHAALASVKLQVNFGRPLRHGIPRKRGTNQYWGLLASWSPATSKADIVVAQDGSGNFKTIKEAVAALGRMGHNRPGRAVVYVKSGLYHEKVEIPRNLENVMFVGDGIDKTIVTGNQNVVDGASTLSSATFGISGNGFWARDITFENTAGPQKRQAVALRVGSDLAVFYRCSFKGYQDTLLVHSLRQFYRDCQIHGTIDFIFGDASAVFQNCDIFVRRPMDDQSNMITAQGRDHPDQNTGISIINCRVAPSSDFSPFTGRFNSYLGRPWKQYSRTVFLKTDLGGLVHPRGWSEWAGNFALSTLYYGEYMNTGRGASTANRVKWPGFHPMYDPREASWFSVRNFIQGDLWLSATGVPSSLDV